MATVLGTHEMLSASLRARAHLPSMPAVSYASRLSLRYSCPRFLEVPLDICSPCVFISLSTYLRESSDTLRSLDRVLPLLCVLSAQGTTTHLRPKAASCRVHSASPGGQRAEPAQSPLAFLEQE